MKKVTLEEDHAEALNLLDRVATLLMHYPNDTPEIECYIAIEEYLNGVDESSGARGSNGLAHPDCL